MKIWKVALAILFIGLESLFLFKVIEIMPKEDYLVSIPFTTTPSWGTNFTQESIRTYDCRELVNDYWMYPKNYDEVFNLAYELCNNSFPEIFNISREENNNSLFLIGNLSMLKSDLEYLFFNNDSMEAAIIVSSNQTNTTELLPPYMVELNNDQCREIPCKQDNNSRTFNLNYCYICDEDAKRGNSE